MTRNYELTYIMKPDLDAAAQAALIERVSGLVTAEGGAIVKANSWGQRQLAYPIGRYREGVYQFSLVQLEAASLARLEQRLRLLEDILRYLLVRAEEEDNAAPDVMGGAELAEPEAADAAASAGVEGAAAPEPEVIASAQAEPAPESAATTPAA